MPNPEHLMTMSGTLTRVAQTGTADRYGDPTDETTTEAVPRLWLFEGASSENSAQDNVTTRTAEAWFPAGFTASSLDRIEVDGVLWQFNGDPIPRRSPRGAVYVEASLRFAS